MAEFALKTKDLGFRLEQVQDFTPTPMTVATEIYATGTHPYDGSKVDVARTPEEKQTQRSFFFWYKPEMRTLLRGTLNKLGLKSIATRLLDEPQKTTDVTPPPHITPLGQGQNRDQEHKHTSVRRDQHQNQNKSPRSPKGPGFFRRRNRGE